MKIFKKLNYIFLHDEDEQAYLSDYIFFYGSNLFIIFIALLVFYKFSSL